MIKRMLSRMMVLAALSQSLLAGGAGEESALKATWADADHPSGIYHAKSPATLNVFIENISEQEQALDGEVAFGTLTGGEFKPLSITPIAAANLGANQRAKIPLKIEFAGAGVYELRWKRGDEHSPIQHPETLKLQAIFAPRKREAGGGEISASPWITLLPEHAGRIPDYLRDYAAQTSVRRFLFDDRFSFDPTTRIGFAPGTPRSAEQMDRIFTDLAKAKAKAIIRVVLPLADGADAVRIEGFRKWISAACKQSKGTLQGLAIIPEAKKLTNIERDAYRRLYLAAYEEAKKHDKAVVMLGAGSAADTRDLLGEGDLLKYVDAVAVSDAVGQPAISRKLLGEKTLTWVLPQIRAQWEQTPAAAALAESAAVVPVPPPELDRGVTAHLLGGAVLLQRVHPENLPYIAVFQGDGYAVAAIAGHSANTAIDALYPALARSKTSVTPADPDDDRPPYPNLEVSDDTESVRVVDAAGAPVDCRAGDTLYVPAADHFVYVLRNGQAEDLAAILRPATGNRLPLMEIAATAVELPDKKIAVALKLTNISTEELGGTAKLLLPPGPDRKEATLLAEKNFVPLNASKSLELNLPLEGELPTGPVIIELVTSRGTQRTAVLISELHPNRE